MDTRKTSLSHTASARPSHSDLQPLPHWRPHAPSLSNEHTSCQNHKSKRERFRSCTLNFMLRGGNPRAVEAIVMGTHAHSFDSVHVGTRGMSLDSPHGLLCPTPWRAMATPKTCPKTLNESIEMQDRGSLYLLGPSRSPFGPLYLLESRSLEKGVFWLQSQFPNQQW
jgi:hypothetical protein